MAKNDVKNAHPAEISTWKPVPMLSEKVRECEFEHANDFKMP